MTPVEALADLIRAAGWTCTFNCSDIPVGTAVSLQWPMPDNVPATFPGRELGLLHFGQLVRDEDDAADIFVDIQENLKRAGMDEDADGWRTSFDPVTGKFYRNNVYGDAV